MGSSLRAGYAALLMAIPATDLQASLGDLIGADRVTPAGPADAVDGVQPAAIVEPDSIDEAARALAWADEQGLRIAPRGGGTRIGWGNIPSGLDVVLSTRRLNQLVEHAAGDMTATAQAGLPLGALQERLANAGQMLALDVPFADRATIGGLIATNDSGALRLRYGGLRDLLIGITLVRPDGVVAKGGGKVVKNVAGYDLPKLLNGSLGTLGLIAEATFRLHPRPRATATLAIQSASPEDAGAMILRLFDSTLVPTGLTLRWSNGDGCELFLRFGGIGESVAAQVEQARSLISEQRLQAQDLAPEAAARTWDELATQPWSGAEGAIVARCSVLPTEIPPTVRALDEVAGRAGLAASMVIHAHGLGLIYLGPPRTDGTEALLEAVEAIRARLASRDGTLALLVAPLEVKQRTDVWGPPPDTLALMRRIKAELDPRATLNPGRFIGGI